MSCLGDVADWKDTSIRKKRPPHWFQGKPKADAGLGLDGLSTSDAESDGYTQVERPPKRESNRPKRTLFVTAVDLLSRREHAPNELKQKLMDRGFEAAEVATELERLVELKYLSEERYIRARLRYGLRKGWGRGRVKGEIERWGLKVPAEIEAEEMEDLGWVESDALNELVEWKWERLARLKKSDDRAELEKLKQRLVRFVVSRGYPVDQSFRAVDRVIGASPSED